MSIILAALALSGAQAAPAADPHAGHAQHQQQGQAGKPEHKMDCCKDCCSKDKQEAGKMECCEGKSGSHAEHSSHSGNH